MNMNRRNFIGTTAISAISLNLGTSIFKVRKEKTGSLRSIFSQNNNRFSIYTRANIEPLRVFHITDTHLALDDERGEKYLQYSQRMAGAYKSNSHFVTQQKYTTQESFEMTLELAKEKNADFLALTGDIFSFPSLAAVEWATAKLKETQIPFAFVAGNHDWHYEGMDGSSLQLRETWINKHLSPIYQGKNPLFDSYNINGVRFVCIDNSTYEIMPEQLSYFKKQAKQKKPIVLLMHIPLYMPGRSMGYGCANPDWGEKSDRNYEIERRNKWRKEGHTKVTYEFYDEVFRAPNLLAVLAGHTHRPGIDVKNGIPQIVSGHNASAYYSDLTIVPQP